MEASTLVSIILPLPLKSHIKGNVNYKTGSLSLKQFLTSTQCKAFLETFCTYTRTFRNITADFDSTGFELHLWF